MLRFQKKACEIFRQRTISLNVEISPKNRGFSPYKVCMRKRAGQVLNGIILYEAFIYSITSPEVNYDSYKNCELTMLYLDHSVY